MNERIRELAEQAGFSSGAMINIGTGEAEELWIRYNENEDREEFPNSKMMQKFAELIVKECIGLFNYDPSGAMSSMAESIHNDIAVKRIQEHFGVKS